MMWNRDEDQRIAARVRAIWAIIMMWMAYMTLVIYGDMESRWMYIIIGIFVGVIAIGFILWLTRRVD